MSSSTLTLTSTGYTNKIDSGHIGATKTGHYAVNGVQAWSIQQVVNGSFVKQYGTLTGAVTTSVDKNFVVFNRDQTITNFTADLIGPSDGSDWVFVDTEAKKAGPPGGLAQFTNFTINVGTESSGPSDSDIVYFGTAKVKSSSTKAAPTDGTPVVLESNTAAAGEPAVDYIATNVTVNTGSGNDTVVYGGAIITAGATKTVISGTSTNVGSGSDSVGFNQVQAIAGGNTVDLGSDSDVDTINFVNYGGVNQFGGSASVVVSNFGNNDVLILGSQSATGKAAAQTLLTSEGVTAITFT